MKIEYRCRSCGEPQDLDGWDGECGDCADKADLREQRIKRLLLAERKRADDTEGGTCD